MNDKEFRQNLAALLARQRNPDQPAKKNPPNPEPTPKPATMSNKEFRQHIRVLLARQRNEDQPPAIEKKPLKISETSNPPATEPQKKPPAAETRQFKVRRKAK